MRWVTFRGGDGERTGVLSGDAIHALQPGVSLLELIGRGAAGLREAGEDALRSAATTRLDEVTLLTYALTCDDFARLTYMCGFDIFA